MKAIANVAANGDDVTGYFTGEEWEAAARDPISLEEVRQALSSIPGSLAEAVMASREDREVSWFSTYTSSRQHC